MPESQSTPDTEINAEDTDQQISGDEGGAKELAPLVLDPTNLVNEIRRLRDENPDFLKIFNNEVGNAADRQVRRKFEPEITNLQRQLEQERLQRRKLEILQMDEKTIERQFAADPKFAEEYAKIVHYTPEVDNESARIEAAWMDAVQYALDNGVSEDFIAQVATKAANNGYEAPHWSQSIQKLERDIANEILRVKNPNSTPKVNANIVNGSADVNLARQGGSNQSWSFKSVRDFKALPLSKQNEILDAPGGMEYVESLMKKG